MSQGECFEIGLESEGRKENSKEKQEEKVALENQQDGQNDFLNALEHE